MGLPRPHRTEQEFASDSTDEQKIGSSAGPETFTGWQDGRSVAGQGDHKAANETVTLHYPSQSERLQPEESVQTRR
jgi:hypothetical protein